MIKIVADEAIPLVKHYFSDQGDLLLKSGREITHKDVLSADILLIRSVTKVDKNLLQNTKVKFVGSVSAGMDHLDTEWLQQNNINWYAAKGCNATSVVEYVICVIAALQKMGFLTNKKLRAGVVGVGTIGRQVVEKLKILGFDVIQCDPPRAEQEADFRSTSLEDFSELDLITLHTPLTYQGKYATHHLIDKKFLQRQKKNCVLLSAGRGSVINFADLKLYGEHLIWCLDVWENEPLIDCEVLQSAVIATPHIAGHSVQAKQRGVEMVYQKLVDKEKLKVKFPTKTIALRDKIMDWRDVVLKIYDPTKTTREMKEKLLENESAFDLLRNNFSEKYEFGYVKIENAKLSMQDQEILHQLGIP